MEIPSELAVEVFTFVERAVRSRGFSVTPTELREQIGPLVGEWAARIGKGDVSWHGDLARLVAACERLAVQVGGFFLAEKEG